MLNAEDEEVLRRLLEAYLPAPPLAEPDAAAAGSAARPVDPGSGRLAIWESLDEFQRVFFADGATRDHVEAVAAPWRVSGLSAREVRQWLDAGVYADEPDLAVALAGAGFDPREARATTIRYRSDSEVLNVVGAVRGRSEQAAWAVELRARLQATGHLGARETG